MSFQAVKEYFQIAGLGQRVLLLEQSSATVEQAAQALGCAPKQIAKTLFLSGRGAAHLDCGRRGRQGGQPQIQGTVPPKSRHDSPGSGGGSGGPSAGRGVPLLCAARGEGIPGCFPEAVRAGLSSGGQWEQCSAAKSTGTGRAFGKHRMD